MPRAFLRVGGTSLARHQLGLALAMDCQRIICLAREVMPEMLALQHEVERGGGRFHIVSEPRALAGLITANDDLLVLGDGLLADPREARMLLEPGHAVLVQPIETGLANGFERIDINHAAAGAFRIPGRLIEQLVDLPPDCDVVSALTRIALQAGVPMQQVPAPARDGVRWRLIRDEAEAHAIEIDWIREHMGDRAPPTPAALLSRFGLLTLGPSLLHSGYGSRGADLATLVVILLGLGAGWFGFTVVGFALCAVAAILCEGGVMLQRVEQASMSLPAPSLSVEEALGWLLDLALVLLVVWALPLMPWEAFAERLFPPLMLIILARLLPRIFDRGFVAWIEDRALLSLALALAAGFGVLEGAVQALALLLAVAGLMFPGGKLRLT